MNLEEWNRMLMQGVVFNWNLAAKLIRTYGAIVAEASIPGVGSVVIWKEGGPAPREPFEFAGTGVIELRIGDEVWNCITAKTDHPDWNKDTYWPESALAIVNVSAEGR